MSIVVVSFVVGVHYIANVSIVLEPPTIVVLSIVDMLIIGALSVTRSSVVAIYFIVGVRSIVAKASPIKVFPYRYYRCTI